ncbi:MAG: alanine racemase [Desulfovibrionaceae bacterium]|nr:alanine racemase [Desulfovibrionaceae bacterium]
MGQVSFSPSRCHIDLACLARNFAKMGDPKRVMPVIKSDAYGHGLMPVAHTLDKNGCTHFAVGTVSEGRALREAGFSQDIVVLLGALNRSEWAEAYKLHLLVPVVDFKDLEFVGELATGDQKLPIALALNTGMGRLGFNLNDLAELQARLKSLPRLDPVLALSHYACCDMPEEQHYTKEQAQSFSQMTEVLKSTYPKLRCSLNNSAGTIMQKDAAFDLDRPGITLYGGNPFVGTTWEHLGCHFEWVMSVSAPILQVRKLQKGESVSYGRIFKADHPMTIAILGIGYATGYARALSNRAFVVIHGEKCRQIGRVCMGMIMVDVSNLSNNIVAGEDAWILGGPTAIKITADDLAHTLGTISYEVLCLFGATNERIYH